MDPGCTGGDSGGGWQRRMIWLLSPHSGGCDSALDPDCSPPATVVLSLLLLRLALAGMLRHLTVAFEDLLRAALAWISLEFLRMITPTIALAFTH